ncbi:GvpL/GvpF family gas vesicle protein [Terribacillus saccharophilus]|uniref:GvpL/GvpF family gas vesicle protein n=1 Tax=Terribacillus saccharophilus TaxID=361277 RepID=UPI003981BB93
MGQNENYVYLYGVVPADEIKEKPFNTFTGIDKGQEASVKIFGKLAAIYTEVDAEQYEGETLEKRMKEDLEWLQDSAMHHHEALLALQKEYTLIPMKFCTIYVSEESLEQKLLEQQSTVLEMFNRIADSEEWNLKIYCDDTPLREHVLQHNPNIKEKLEEIESLPPGRQFFAKRKIDQLVDEELDKEKNDFCEQVHAELIGMSSEDKVKTNWSRDVTGKELEMSWNSVYLIPENKVEGFLDLIQQKNEENASAGWRFEATGPWPAYHFVY